MDEEDDYTSGEDKMEDAVCSAGQCSRPTSTAVEWVQCDTCQLWYHLACVGLTSESVQFIEAYYCFPCKQKRAARQGSGSVTVPARQGSGPVRTSIAVPRIPSLNNRTTDAN